MVYEFKFPDVGEGITEGEIVEWNVKEGDEVQQHQVLGKIETDKAVAEMPSPVAGKIVKLHFKPGETVKVGETLVTIAQKGEQAPSITSKVPSPPKVKLPFPVQQPKPAQPQFKAAGVVGYLEEAPEEVPQKDFICEFCGDKFQSQDELEEHESIHKLQQELKATPAVPKILATPSTRKLAKDIGVDISQIKGTGPGGRITDADVKFLVPKAERAQGNSPMVIQDVKQPELIVKKKYDMYGYVERIPVKGIRKVTASKMVESVKHIPHVTHFDEIDVTDLWDLRERMKKIAELRGIHLTFLPYIIKSVIFGLKEYPYLNSTLDEESNEIILKKYYNIGIAVDTGEGLIVPVVKGADKKSIFDIAKEIEDLADKSRKRKIDLGDLKGGTFTITNIGSIRGKFATPIINYPEAAILGLGKIYDKLELNDGIASMRKILPISLAFDHRILDGAYAAKFVDVLAKNLENPKLLLAKIPKKD